MSLDNLLHEIGLPYRLRTIDQYPRCILFYKFSLQLVKYLILVQSRSNQFFDILTIISSCLVPAQSCMLIECKIEKITVVSLTVNDYVLREVEVLDSLSLLTTLVKSQAEIYLSCITGLHLLKDLYY